VVFLVLEALDAEGEPVDRGASRGRRNCGQHPYALPSRGCGVRLAEFRSYRSEIVPCWSRWRAPPFRFFYPLISAQDGFRIPRIPRATGCATASN